MKKNSRKTLFSCSRLKEVELTMKRTLPRRLRVARVKKGWRVIDVAAASGLKENTVASYEQGIRTPGIVALVRLCKVLNVSVEWMIGDSESDLRFQVIQ